MFIGKYIDNNIYNNHTSAPATITGANPNVDIIVPPAKYKVPANIAFLPILEVAVYNATEPVVLIILAGRDTDVSTLFPVVPVPICVFTTPGSLIGVEIVVSFCNN